MVVIIINGVPGVGKSTIALVLASLLKIDKIIQTDTIKDFFQAYDLNPISYCATHEAWKYFGEKKTGNIIKGFNEHTSYFNSLLLNLIKVSHRKGKHIIIEGVQATPDFFRRIEVKEKIGFFLTLSDFNEHKLRFNLKNNCRAIPNLNWFKNYNEIQVINTYLLDKAKDTGFYIIDNKEIKSTVGFILKKCHSLPINRRGVIYATI